MIARDLIPFFPTRVIVIVTLYGELDICDHTCSYLWITTPRRFPSGLHPYYQTCMARTEAHDAQRRLPQQTSAPEKIAWIYSSQRWALNMRNPTLGPLPASTSRHGGIRDALMQDPPPPRGQQLNKAPSLDDWRYSVGSSLQGMIRNLPITFDNRTVQSVLLGVLLEDG